MTTAVAPKERPIIFGGESVRAILEGRKTQTRRVIKPQPVIGGGQWFWKKCSWTADSPHCPTGALEFPVDYCPYGVPGERLWVRESFCFESFWPASGIDDYALTCNYAADGGKRQLYECDAPLHVGFSPQSELRKWEGKQKAAIHMPRWASRLTLDLVKVRVERVQDITAADCIAEGIPSRGIETNGQPNLASAIMYLHDYEKLWDSLNAGRGYSWESNPWVWVLEFAPVTAPAAAPGSPQSP